MSIESGIHVVNRNSAAALLREAEAQFRVFQLVSDRISSKAALFEKLRQAFGLPDYFGQNWDALEECLRDLPTEQRKGFLTVIDSGEALLGLPERDFQTFISILRSTAHFWASEGVQFAVMLIASSEVVAEALAAASPAPS